MRLSKDDFVELIQRPLIKSLNQQQADEKVADGARWLDVRKAADFNRSHHTDALNIPLEELRGRSSQLSLDEDYVVCAASPAEAAIAAFLLRERGLEVSALTDIQSSFPSPAEEASAESTLAPALDQETDPLGLEGDSGLTPDSADGELPQVAEQVEDSSDALRLQLEQTQARFHNALYQRVAQLRRLKQLLKEEREKNAALREELVAANSARQALDGQLSAAQSTADRQRDLTRQSDGGEDVLRLKAKIEELQQDLDEAQDVLQEASAEESSYQWERLRWQSQQEAIEKSLQQQKDINEVLREENEETMRRMEAMNEQIRCLQAETQKKAG
jgi:rhodanese-related sulfurtransferase